MLAQLQVNLGYMRFCHPLKRKKVKKKKKVKKNPEIIWGMIFFPQSQVLLAAFCDADIYQHPDSLWGTRRARITLQVQGKKQL